MRERQLIALHGKGVSDEFIFIDEIRRILTVRSTRSW